MDTSFLLTLNQCENSIEYWNDEISKEWKKYYRIYKRLKKSKKEGDAIIKETNQIDFLLEELQKNLLSLQSDEARSLHEERITDLKLRKMALESRKPFYAPSEYQSAEAVLEMHQKNIDAFKASIIAVKNRMEILKVAENKAKGRGQSKP